MKKLSLFILPIMSLVSLTNCGGGNNEIVYYKANAINSDHLFFTTMNGEAINDLSIKEGENFKFRVKTDGEDGFSVPIVYTITIDEVQLIEGYYVERTDNKKEATVTIQGEKIIGDIEISGKVAAEGQYSYSVPYSYGLVPIESGVHDKSEGTDLTLTFEGAQKNPGNDDTYKRPKSENIYVQFDNYDGTTVWVSPAEGLSYFCSYDEQTGVLTIKDDHISSEIIIIAKANDFNLLEASTWDLINKVSNSGAAHYVYELGEEKSVEVNGVNLHVRIIGFDHDEIVDGGSLAGITFEFTGLIKKGDGSTLTFNWDESSCNDYDNSIINEVLNKNEECVFNKLPEDLHNIIKTVNKNIAYGKGTFISHKVKLFPLAHDEIAHPNEKSCPDEGFMYDYFAQYAEDESLLNQSRKRGGVYWLRSPRLSNTKKVGDLVWFCHSGGDLANNTSAKGSSFGVSPAFCI